MKTNTDKQIAQYQASNMERGRKWVRRHFNLLIVFDLYHDRTRFTDETSVVSVKILKLQYMEELSKRLLIFDLNFTYHQKISIQALASL